MENFDLRKYLAENKLLKEEIDYPSIKDEMKKIYDIDVDLDTIEDFVTSYNDSEGMDIFDTTEREDFYLYLKYLEKEKYESFKIAMKNEFDGAMRAMDQSPEEYLQDIINYTEEFLDTKDTPLDEFDLSGFFEVENGVGRGDYTKEEAINFMKQWAEDKLENLNESLH